eukprot:scaffold7297_cov69-Phaeocystis_antarctica.AAC.3
MRAPRAPMATVAASISSSAPAPRASPLHRTSSGAARPRAKATSAGVASAMCAECSSMRHAASVGRSVKRSATSSASRTPDSRAEGSANGGACVIGRCDTTLPEVICCQPSTRNALVRNPSNCAILMPPSLPSVTSDAMAPDADATAHSTPTAGPRISTPSTANGSRVSAWPSPPRLSRVTEENAPSMSAGCICVPASEARRRSRSRAVASPPPSHAASNESQAVPSCTPTAHRSRAAASSSGRHAAAPAAAHFPLQCTAAIPSPEPLRTSNAPPSSSAHSTHAAPPASSTSGCRKNTPRSAAPAAEEGATAEHAARAVSR